MEFLFFFVFLIEIGVKGPDSDILSSEQRFGLAVLRGKSDNVALLEHLVDDVFLVLLEVFLQFLVVNEVIFEVNERLFREVLVAEILISKIYLIVSSQSVTNFSCLVFSN